MLILNINGPMNAGKTTVSKILAQKMPNSHFIEVDDLMTDAEQEALGLSIPESWKERVKRLNKKLLVLRNTKQYDTVIFAYPITESLYQKWMRLTDKKTRFLNITLAPSLSVCLTNRGSRELDDWTKKRIPQMYAEGYHNPPFSDLILCNDNQAPEQTAEIIMGFIAHALNPEQQRLHLVERRWPALLSGEKVSTFRLNEGFVHKGFLVYKDCPREQWTEVVYVTRVYYAPLRQAIEIDGFDDHTPDMETALRQMRVHYPEITLDTNILLAQHMSVPETRTKYPQEVENILQSCMSGLEKISDKPPD